MIKIIGLPVDIFNDLKYKTCHLLKSLPPKLKSLFVKVFVYCKEGDNYSRYYRKIGESHCISFHSYTLIKLAFLAATDRILFTLTPDVTWN